MENTEVKEKEKIVAVGEPPRLSPEEEVFVKEMIEAGVWHGRKHSKLNPKMSQYIVGARRGIDVIDLLRARALLDEAADFLKGVREKKEAALVVGIKPATSDLVKEFAAKFDWPYVTGRWLGGTLTNFKTIFKRVDYFKKLRADKESGALAKYTKKEQLVISWELDKLARNFSGVENMADLPAAVVVIGVSEHATTIREANRLNIPVVGLINTDGDPDKIKYPIPANDNARPSVKWVLDKLAEKLSQLELKHSEPDTRNPEAQKPDL